MADYQALTDLWTSRDNTTTQINWDAMYAANYANNANDDHIGSHTSARYILERRHNDIQEAVASFNYVNTEYEHLKMTLGVEGKFAQGIHYKTIDDLLGANQWIDIDAFADRDIKELATNSGFTQNEITLLRENDVRTGYNDVIQDNGQRYGYDYRINMGNFKAWFQNEWNFTEVDLYYALALDYSMMQRTTNMLNGRAWYLTYRSEQMGYEDVWKYYGKATYELSLTDNMITKRAGHMLTGDAHHFLDPAFKAGVTYKINGRNRLKVNAWLMIKKAAGVGTNVSNLVPVIKNPFQFSIYIALFSIIALLCRNTSRSSRRFYEHPQLLKSFFFILFIVGISYWGFYHKSEEFLYWNF